MCSVPGMSQIDTIARRRRTLKLLPNPSTPLPTGGLERATVDALIAAAGWAPFHRPNAAAREGQAVAPEPWRFYALDAAACRALIGPIGALPKPPGKLTNMLAAADALILATWLPEPSEDEPWEADTFNLEHIAATAAAVQTLLLAATERGIENYWSSGGSLGTAEAFRLLRIPAGELLLGAIFLFPDPPDDVEAAPGKLRTKRTAPGRWSRWVEVPRP